MRTFVDGCVIVVGVICLSVIGKGSEAVPRVKHATPDSECTPGWSQFGTSCYRVIRQSHFWDDAAGYCQILGAHLVSIETPEEFRFLTRYIPRFLGRRLQGRELFWTSGTLRIHDYEFWSPDDNRDVFTWADGTNRGRGQPVTYANWYPGQPDNVNVVEDFLCLMHEGGVWGLNDVPHDFALMSVCEQVVVCAEDWMPYEGSCYWFEFRKLTWTGAYDACLVDHAELVTIATDEEYDWLSSQLGFYLEGTYGPQQFWTSAVRNFVTGEWNWHEGGSLGRDFEMQHHWLPGAPHEEAGTGGSALSLTYTSGDWGFEDVSNLQPLMYVCEKPFRA